MPDSPAEMSETPELIPAKPPPAPHRPLRRRGWRPVPAGRAAAAGALPVSAARVTVVANTADDLWIHGLKVCPDLDTVMYTLGGGIDPERGWGRTTRPGTPRRSSRRTAWSRRGSASATATSPPTSSARRCSTRATRSSAVTAALCKRWLAAAGGCALLPMTDDRVETHVVDRRPRLRRAPRRCTSRSTGSGTQAQVPAHAVVAGRARRRHAGARACSRRSPRPTSCWSRPSNPVVSVGTILGVPGIRDALRDGGPRRGLSRIVAGHHVRGMAEQLLDVDRGGGLGGRGRRALRRPVRGRRARRLAGRHGRRRPASSGSRRPGSRAARCRCDDRPRRHRRHGRGRARPGPMTRSTRRSSARLPSTASARSPRATDLGAAARRARSSTATSSWSPARSSARPRAASARGDRRGRDPRRDRARGGPARADHDRARPISAW